jgi:SAM-dependent methyltransferase
MEQKSPAATLAALILDCASEQILDKAVFSKCRDKNISRATLTLKRVKGEVILQLETLRTAEAADTEVNQKKPVQATHENLTPADAPAGLEALVRDFDQINLMTTLGNCEFRRSKGGKETLNGGSAIRKALDAPPAGDSAPKRITVGGNDKVKRRILSGAEPFLVELGVSDQNGRVHDKKQAKYRQINRFLELIRDVESHLPAEGTLHIADLCCGKSYLSFAVYHYFTAIRGRAVRMVGVDMKAEVMEDCGAIAGRLGMDGLEFVCGDVTLFEFPEGGLVDMVISLHACDIATDIVLDKAVDWGAKVVLSTPCCHHDLNRRLNSPALGFVAEHSMLRQKLCDAATDALRLKKLEANGYDVAALELIDPEETPKNIMLRGIRRHDPASARCKRAAEEYAAAYEFLTGEKLVMNQ